ncbi:dynamin family protein-like protein [Plenodomus tracheiphilus IPT5]|uniref:Dynamin family protein-like protein n=1 Tax=Plenodomus tracheiphilus IPT5 TaxID=1408161 RepID=A0A6A7AXB2_9PLEO|nr:dynamin family protein-like protein [Plenodomus tracheiphilus IPT5]
MPGIPTRSSARHAPVKPAASASTPSNEGNATDATVEEMLCASDQGHRSSRIRISSVRNDVSRLSEGFEPMKLDDGHKQSSSDVTAHDEVDPLGQDVKEAAAALSQLEGLGLQKFDISLPRCNVLGQQSTGKSSVIEAISGIKTPRDTDTCTCCPLYINMKPSNNPSDKWMARVSLQRDYVLDSRPKQQAKEVFPGWMPAESNQIFFAETQSRDDLEHIIRSAQTANLNPLVDPQVFMAISGPRMGDRQNKFSPNTVCIDITEPNLPSLSFFDLPGLISQAETEEEAYTVPLVQNLVGQYVREEGSLILVTCDLGTDIANSTAAGLARQHDATHRCIGVLTKPDLLAPGTTDQSLADVLDGKRYGLGHGYFVVKNLNKREIQSGLSHHDARLKETEFFNNGRWANNLRRFHSRFGTRNLQLYLSKQLAQRTFVRLPEIYAQIQTQLNHIEDELRGIRVTPAHSAVRVITDHILDFSQEVRHEIEGEHEHTCWQNTWEVVQQAFEDALVAMKPTVATRGDLDEGIYASTIPGTSADEAFLIDSDDEHDADVRMRDVPETPHKKRKMEEGSPALSPMRMPAKKQPAGTPSKRSGQKKVSGDKPMPAEFARYRKKFVLDEVVREIKQSAKSKIRDQIHPKVREAMIIEPLTEWQRPMEVFFSTLKKELLSRMQFLFDKNFAQRKGTELFDNAWKIVNEILQNNLHQQQTIMAQESLVNELEGPYTFHQEVFNQEKAVVREKYRQHRQRMRFSVFLLEAKRHLRREMTPSEQDRVRKDGAKMAVIAKEPYENVLNLITEVTAYYNIAVIRFHEKICMRIESKFFKQLRTQLREELETGLRIYDEDDGPTIAQRLLAESPEQERRRQELLTRKEALKKGLECLKDLRHKYEGDAWSSGGGSITHGFGHGGFGPSMVTPPAEDV